MPVRSRVIGGAARRVPACAGLLDLFHPVHQPEAAPRRVADVEEGFQVKGMALPQQQPKLHLLPAKSIHAGEGQAAPAWKLASGWCKGSEPILSQDFDGEVSLAFERDGLTCTISAPLRGLDES